MLDHLAKQESSINGDNIQGLSWNSWMSQIGRFELSITKNLRLIQLNNLIKNQCSIVHSCPGLLSINDVYACNPNYPTFGYCPVPKVRPVLHPIWIWSIILVAGYCHKLYSTKPRGGILKSGKRRSKSTLKIRRNTTGWLI